MKIKKTFTTKAIELKGLPYILSFLCIFCYSCTLFGGGHHDDNNVAGGDVVWRNANKHENITQTQPLIDANNAYFLQDGQLKSATLKEGTVRWSLTIEADGRGGDFARKMLESENKIFFDEGFQIIAISKSTGKVIWNTQITHDPKEISGIGSPIMSQDNSYLYAGRKGYVVQLKKEDGQITRRYSLDQLVPEGIVQGSTEPVISPLGDNILYVPASYFDNDAPSPEKASGGNVFAYEANSGNLLWKHQITVTVPDYSTEAPDDSLTGSPNIYDIAVTDNKVVVLAGFYIVALNRMSGEPVWKTYFSEGGFDVGLAVKGNDVYAASIGTFATRVNLDNGKVIWKQDIKYSNSSIPTVLNNRLYFVNDGGANIWVLDTEDGSVIYKKPPPNFKNDDYDVYLSSLAVGNGYMVDVGSKAVYCLKVP